jgi:hypothetical protein
MAFFVVILLLVGCVTIIYPRAIGLQRRSWGVLMIIGSFVIAANSPSSTTGSLSSASSSSNMASSSRAAASVTKTFEQSVHERVISDAEEEYRMARGGVDRCVQAGMVAAAYLQAHDQFGYRQWKLREDQDCRY